MHICLVGTLVHFLYMYVMVNSFCLRETWVYFITCDPTHCHTHQVLVQVVALLVVVSPEEVEEEEEEEEEDYVDVVCCILVELAEVTPVIMVCNNNIIILCDCILTLQVVGVAWGVVVNDTIITDSVFSCTHTHPH